MSVLKDYHQVHIIGIGGAGMSAIARLLKARGLVVHGSDRQEGQLVGALRADGIPVAVGHAVENIGAADLVLASSAIPEENPEIRAARQRSIPVMQRSEFLPLLTAGYDVVAVAGAHGKTTVAGMIATVLLSAGLDPTYIVGGVVQNLDTNARLGTGTVFVIEADEYRNTFLSLSPAIAVVTNVEYDHPDVFQDLGTLRAAFDAFVKRIREGGTLIICSDDAFACALGKVEHPNVGKIHLYGKEPAHALSWQAARIRPNAIGGVDFDALYEGRQLGVVRLRVPGEHNAVNALAALSVAGELGLSFEVASAALEKFSGTARRFEILGEAQEVLVIDDYAHHPTQIKVVLAMARQRYPGRRIFAVWQPHTFSRMKALRKEFLQAFDEADCVVVLPIYAAREVDDGTVTHESLAAALVHPSVSAASSLDEAAQQLSAEVKPGDVVILMGAGDEYRVAEKLLERLQ